MINEAILVLGSNLNDKEAYINQAIKILSLSFKCNKRSTTHQSKPWGFASKNDFINVALSIECDLTAMELLNKLIEIENSLGRVRSNTERYTDRTIDIDIILFGDQVINVPELTLPHPRFHLRKFCLQPMLEIVPEKIVPGFNKTVKELYNELINKEIKEATVDKV